MFLQEICQLWQPHATVFHQFINKFPSFQQILTEHVVYIHIFGSQSKSCYSFESKAWVASFFCKKNCVKTKSRHPINFWFTEQRMNKSFQISPFLANATSTNFRTFLNSLCTYLPKWATNWSHIKIWFVIKFDLLWKWQIFINENARTEFLTSNWIGVQKWNTCSMRWSSFFYSPHSGIILAHMEQRKHFPSQGFRVVKQIFHLRWCKIFEWRSRKCDESLSMSCKPIMNTMPFVYFVHDAKQLSFLADNKNWFEEIFHVLGLLTAKKWMLEQGLQNTGSIMKMCTIFKCAKFDFNKIPKHETHCRKDPFPGMCLKGKKIFMKSLK